MLGLDDGLRQRAASLAVFHDEHVRIIDAHAVVAVDLHDLLQPRFGRELHQLQRGAGDVAIHITDKFGVHQDLAAEQLLHPLDLLDMLAGDKGALQVGDVLVDLEGVQRRVVPGEFEQRAVARRDFRRCLAVGHLTLVLRDQFQHRCFADGSDSDDQRMAASGQELGELLHVLRHRVGEETDFLLDNAAGVRHRIAELQRLVEAAEADDAFHPVVHRRHADLDLQHQSVGAPHVVHLQRLLTAQLDQLRLLLNRDGAYAQHVAARR